MPRAASVVTFVALATLAGAGCRGILGIEPLELVDASTTDGGAGDATSAGDARTDTGTPGGEGGPAEGGGDNCATSSNCRSCCHQAHDSAFVTLADTLKRTGCICGSGLCTADCSSPNVGPCSGDPGAPPPPCGPCIDNVILPPPGGDAAAPPPCSQGETQCLGDPNCGPAIQCLRSCPAP